MRATMIALMAAIAATASAQTPASDGYDITDVAVTITPDISARRIAGAQRMEMRVAAPELRALRFDANALEIRYARADGVAMIVVEEGGARVFTLPRAYKHGEELQLDISYDGAPARGLTISDTLAYTSYFTCDWMMCALDRPGDKARFALTLTLPEGWVGLGSGARNQTRQAAGRQIVTWRQREPYPALLWGFAAGRLTEVRTHVNGVDFIAASDAVSSSDLRATFADTPRMVAFFSGKAGVRFPHDTYWQMVVPGGPAQEGAGFAVLGVETVSGVRATPPDDWALAHELAHQYWGNLVTCRDWQHFWLNEGLTTFMTAAWKEERWGAAAYAEEIMRAQTRWDFAKERGWDKPLAFAGAYPDLRTRRAIQYSKGMLFVVELRKVLGEDAFWRGLRAYTRAHAGGTVVSADLQRAFERASGRDLSALFDAWVYD